ncbi:hypothetical protein QAO71_16910 (plasmid) [Halopseudomonas sp. SMJS2]|uniref:hypothetical protein n=1 Tax=Halopseudomonas sp. SMJS2 TaxID=3041098 RepID=UPI002452920C|nr:hypothetical protein [Halopseudomonas sp. SMJS2]WGK63451.1 hypothetical protein QAO71_16910 [Halopseudomonas sp. SMJS2]
MKIKPGLFELVIAITLSVVLATAGKSWTEGLFLAGYLMVIASIPLLALNYFGLPAKYKASIPNCLLLPYSTFLVVLPRVLLLPLAEHLNVPGRRQKEIDE